MTVQFNLKLLEFVSLIQIHQNKVDSKVSVIYEVGRKYTKIILIYNHISNNREEVRYFVKHSDGSIFGAKSKLAPNLNWYFGTIYNADKWDWSDFHGRSINDDTVRCVGQYGPYTHYMKI